MFSLVLIVAIAVGFVARRAELAGERDIALTTAAELGASQVGSLVDVVETTALAGTDPAEAAAALAVSEVGLDVCSISVDEIACAGDEPARDDAIARQATLPTADAAATGRAEVTIDGSLVTVAVDGPRLSVIVRMPVELAGTRSDIDLRAVTTLPDDARIGTFAVENGERRTVVRVPVDALLFVAASGDDGIAIPGDEFAFYAIIFLLAVMLLLLAGATMVGEQRNLLERASIDQLTRLPNRGEFERRANDAMMAVGRSDSKLCVLLFDLNGFKYINDTYGHSVGDRVLQVIAERLRGAVRDGDVVARWGGDEFVVAMPGIESEEQGARRAQQLAREISGRTRLEGVAEEMRVKAAVGVALWPDHGTDLETLIVSADRAMYRAKREGLVCRVATPPPAEAEITTALLHGVRSTG